MFSRRTEGLPIPELRPALSDHEAVVEAARCLYCYDAPCARACPAGIDVAEFIRKIATGNRRGSARLLLEANPLAASCARVCPVEELCEGRCVLPGAGARPIPIGRLQRHVMDWALDQPVLRDVVGPESPGRVAVVGAGPAGLACAVELRRHGHAVTIFEARERTGGLGTYAIAAYKMTAAFAQAEAEWLVRELGIDLHLGSRVGVDVSWADLESRFDAVFLGIGLEQPVALAVPGEDLADVVDALDLIAAHRAGSALPVELEGREVLVVGGGNTAVDAAILVLDRGARRSGIVYRRSEAEMPAYAAERALAFERGVEVHLLRAPLRVLGEDRVEGLECQVMRLGDPDASGRRQPIPTPDPPVTLRAQVVIRAIGQKIHDALLGGVSGLRLEHGLLRVGKECGQTDNPRYFAGGDCVNGGREVVHAVADGRRAARAIHRLLAGKEVSRG
jgi:dihydropyrimidine dehydrogenase (NAD+) subunit PreT